MRGVPQRRSQSDGLQLSRGSLQQRQRRHCRHRLQGPPNATPAAVEDRLESRLTDRARTEGRAERTSECVGEENKIELIASQGNERERGRKSQNDKCAFV